MRVVRLMTGAFATLLVLSLAAAWGLPRFLDWSAYRGTIEAVASAGLGRPVRLAGAIQLSLLPAAILRAGDVSIADTGDGASASADEIELRVGFAGLLAGQFQAQELVLRGARMHLPWPLSGPALAGGRPVAGLHARLEDGTLEIGGLTVSRIEGELSVNPATVTLMAGGVGSTMGRSWRMTGRLGRPGADGSATLEISLDGQGTLRDTGGLLSGQIAADGSLQGRITGRGPDLSVLLAAPARPWRGEGRVVAGGGLAVADDLEVEIGGMPARGAVALRFLPQLRLDAALATSRLDLDAWLPALLRAGRTAVPTGIDLSAEAASFAGGTLRRLRAGFDIWPGGVTVREVGATLPGEAELQLSGTFSGTRFEGTGRLSAPRLGQTVDWLRPRAPSLVAALPAGALQQAAVTGSVLVDAEGVALGGLRGTLNGASIAGDLAVHGGSQPAVSAKLQLTAPVLDPWLPDPPSELSAATAQRLDDAISAAVQALARVSADLTLEASRPVWRGTPFERFVLALRSDRGTVQLRQAALTGADLTVGVSGQAEPGGTIRDGELDLRLQRASVAGALLPARWRAAEKLFRGSASLHLGLDGSAHAFRLTATAGMADAEARADGVLDLADRSWRGSLSFRHPGAPRLLDTLGLPGAASWLGDGSLSAQAEVEASDQEAVLKTVDAAAGALRATGDLTVRGFPGSPTLTGTVDAETLPLPLPYAHCPDPLFRPQFAGWQGQLGVHARRVLLGLSPALDDASAFLSLAGGTLRIDGLKATLSQGRLSGTLSLDNASPPHLAATAQVAGVALTGPLFGTPYDVSAGQLDAAVDLSASGYSPSGLVATLRGTLQTQIRDGVFDGLDEAAALTAGAPATEAGAADTGAAPAGLTRALGTGATPFKRLDLAASVAEGAVALTKGTMDTEAGQWTATGTFDLLSETLLARLTLRPADGAAPALGLRLSGTAAAPSRRPDAADPTHARAAR